MHEREEDETNMEEESEDEEEEIKICTLTQAKEYAAALHNFILANMSTEKSISDFEESSYKTMKAVGRVVDCTRNKQTAMTQYFPVLDIQD